MVPRLRAVAPEIRFQRFFDQPEIGCWLWRGKTAGTKSRYGYFAPGRRPEDPRKLAHRYAYELWVGPIPEGMEIHHKCRNPLCVRPDHLEAVTPQRNSELERMTVCRHGHDLTVDENCLWDKQGRRRGCIICTRTRARDRMRRLAALQKG